MLPAVAGASSSWRALRPPPHQGRQVNLSRLNSRVLPQYPSRMLPQLRVASPCTADWERMTGDDRVRYCDQCTLNVYNFSEMSSMQIEQLLLKSTGRVCGRLYQRADGTILTKDCPVGFGARARRVSPVAGAALAAMMSAASATAQNPREGSSVIQAVAGAAGVKLTIVDPTGAVIAGASVVIADRTGAHVVSGETDQVGGYRTLDLKSGSWKITVSKAGFTHQDVNVILRDREVVQSVITLEIVTSTMGVIVSVDDLAVPYESNFRMPNYISPNQTPPAAALPPPKPRNPVSRLLRKLHF